MYTFKEKGKTVGKRLSRKQAPLYRAQIERFRAFEKLSRQFVGVSEKLADLEGAGGDEGKKNSSRRSGPNKKAKPAASWKK